MAESVCDSRIETSFIVPTRARPEKLQRFFQSVIATTTDLRALEIVLVIDEDDPTEYSAVHERLNLKIVRGPGGRTMGELNRAGYTASSGRKIMLMNDDVILKTIGWDTRVNQIARGIHDEIYLIHVNDLLFKERLCTFPFVSRRFCEIVGEICPVGYLRYRIDDHIYNIFNMLSWLGERRILYLPDIVFEHDNFVAEAGDRRAYQPNEKIIAIDAVLFDELLPCRKVQTANLFNWIAEAKQKAKAEIPARRLEQLTESFGIRTQEYVDIVRTEPGHLQVKSSVNTRVTIGIVSADIQNPHAQKCLKLVKEHTHNYDLIILDNNRGPKFNHPREMNRIMSICKTDYLVLMDDDIYVEKGWLDGLLASMTPNVGLVTPLHRDKAEKLSYSGVCLVPNGEGKHSHFLDLPAKARPVPTICSAAMLIDMKKCAGIRMNEQYKKYFLDLDYGLAVWEAGFEVVVTPAVSVVHLGGATLQHGSHVANSLNETDLAVFQKDWIKTGRLAALEKGEWKRHEFLRMIESLPVDPLPVLRQKSDEKFDDFILRLKEIREVCRMAPAISSLVHQKTLEFIRGESDRRRPQSEVSFIADALGGDWFHTHSLVEEDFHGFNIIFDERYFAIHQKEGAYSRDKVRRHYYQRHFEADSVEELKRLIAAFEQERASDQVGSPSRYRRPVMHYAWRLIYSFREQRPLWVSDYERPAWAVNWDRRRNFFAYQWMSFRKAPIKRLELFAQAVKSGRVRRAVERRLT